MDSVNRQLDTLKCDVIIKTPALAEQGTNVPPPPIGVIITDGFQVI